MLGNPALLQFAGRHDIVDYGRGLHQAVKNAQAHRVSEGAEDLGNLLKFLSILPGLGTIILIRSSSIFICSTFHMRLNKPQEADVKASQKKESLAPLLSGIVTHTNISLMEKISIFCYTAKNYDCPLRTRHADYLLRFLFLAVVSGKP